MNGYIKYAKNVFSQNGEDGIIEQLFKELHISNGVVVEFGAWDGIYLSNVFNLWKDQRFNAILIEGNKSRCVDLNDLSSKNKNIECINAFIEPDINHNNSIDNILTKSKFNLTDDEFCLMSIDVDSCDCLIFESMNKFRPKIVLIETNSNYTVDQEFKSSGGCSILSVSKLAQTKGYKMVCYTGNAILVRNDLLNQLSFVPESLEQLYVTTDYIENVLQKIDSFGNISNQVYYKSNSYSVLITKERNSILCK